MCGIFALLNREIDEALLLRAVDALSHRGPDASGVFRDHEKNVYLGHTRLAIVDLETGDQPLYGDDLVLVCNGELYDDDKVRRTFQDRGYTFQSKSDSEIILPLYEEYGLGCFEHLRGEFAFILYDKKRQLVIACRDRFGIKPLYYAPLENGLGLSSEMKALFAARVVEPEIDPLRLRDYMVVMVPDSVFKGIEAVPPGHYLVFNLQTLEYEVKPYWQYDLPRAEARLPAVGLKEHTERVRALVEEAVRLRLRSDVPVGVYLSGGIDSATVSALVARHKKGRFKTFSLAFTDDDHFNEAALARKMAEEIGSEHIEIEADQEALVQSLEDALYHSELPFTNLHVVGKHLLSKTASRHVKVVLTGEGGDETFLGYGHFRQQGRGSVLDFGAKRNDSSEPAGTKRGDNPAVVEIEQRFGVMPKEDMRKLIPLQDFYCRLFKRKHRARLRSNSLLSTLDAQIDADEWDGRNSLSRIQYYALRVTLANYVLVHLGDRQEMAHSLEGRTPLLDHHLFEYVKTIPQHLKLHPEAEKYVFREMARDLVIPEIVDKEKWDFVAPGLPVRAGLNQTMTRLVRKHLSYRSIQEAGVFSYTRVVWLRFLFRVTAFNQSLQNPINSLLTFILTTQILGDRMRRVRGGEV